MLAALADVFGWVPVAFGGGAIGAGMVALIRSRPQMAKIKADSDASIRTDLLARIVALELAHDADRKACDERVERVEARYEKAHRELRAEFQTIRHERNNLRQGFNYLIVRIKGLGNDELSRIAADAEEMTIRGDQLIALEKGAMNRPD